MRHLWIRFTGPLQSPPGGTSAQWPLPDAQLKHSSRPDWSFDFPFPLPLGLPGLFPPLLVAVDLCLARSSCSAVSLRFLACLLSRLAWVLRVSVWGTVVSCSMEIAFWPPWITSKTAASCRRAPPPCRCPCRSRVVDTLGPEFHV